MIKPTVLLGQHVAAAKHFRLAGFISDKKLITTRKWNEKLRTLVSKQMLEKTKISRET